MHVLIVSQYFWPEEFRVNDLAADLVQRGHEVTVLTGLPNYPKGKLFRDFRANPSAFSTYQGVNIVRVPLISRRSGALWLALNYLSFILTSCSIGVWRVRNVKFDVIFSPQLSPITAMLPAVLLRWLRRKKFAMWVLDLWPDTLQALGVVRSSRALGWLGRLVAFIYHRTDTLYVQSRGFVPNVEKYLRRPKSIEYLANWSEDVPDLAAVVPSPLVPPASPGQFSVMFAGAIGESQDFPTILDAAEALRDERGLRWLIVGDGRVSDWVASEIQRRKLSSMVMLGRHPVDAMPSFFVLADAMLVSLKPEPIFAMTVPGKVQSYLAAGKPVIAMLDGEGAKVVDESRCGMTVRPGDSGGLVAALRALMKLPADELAILGQNAKIFSDQYFDRKTQIDRIEARLLAHANDGAR